MINRIGTLAKYIDQPLIVNKFSRAVPGVLIGGATAFGVYDTFKAPQGERKKKGIKNFFVLSATALASLASIRGLKVGKKQLFEGLIEQTTKSEIINSQKRLVKRFKNILEKSPNLDEATKALKDNAVVAKALNTAEKGKALSVKEVADLENAFKDSKLGKKLLLKLTGDPEELSSKDIFGEIKRLSLLGAVPVIGGILGGMAGDYFAKDYSPKKNLNKIKEGFYQYFANIFLCNVGAGAALFSLEGLKNAKIIGKPSTALRAGSMVAGILATGVFGGSLIANFLGKKVLNPMLEACNKDFKTKHKNQNGDGLKGLYDERHPEAVDVALHVDDIATVGVLSGFKWIEPALPLLYFVSGYRAGIGYRNGEGAKVGLHIAKHSNLHEQEFEQNAVFTSQKIDSKSMELYKSFLG